MSRRENNTEQIRKWVEVVLPKCERATAGKTWRNMRYNKGVNVKPRRCFNSPRRDPRRCPVSSENSTKSCQKCGVPKSFGDFPKQKGARDGTRNTCKLCTNSANRDRARRAARRYRQANPDKVRAAQRRWKECNQRHVRQYQKQYYEVHVEYLRASAARYYYENRDQYLERMRRWRAENPSYWHEWQQKNKEKVNHASKQRRSRVKGAEGSFTLEEWLELCASTGDQCLACRRADIPLTVDHVKSLAEGGSNYITNIQPLCISCNSAKGSQCKDYRGGLNGEA